MPISEGPDEKKIEMIKEVMKEHPEGITAIDICRESLKKHKNFSKRDRLKKSTVWHYLNHWMKKMVKVKTSIGTAKKKVGIKYVLRD